MDNVIFGRAEQWLSGVVQDTGLGIPGAAGGNRKAGSVFAVVDGNVAERLAPVLKAVGIEWMPFVAREERKSLDGLQEIVGWLLECEADRGALLLGIGGGVTTDITAFTASVYKRGIRYALVPTTLLAQVDAAIGGKTGLNFHGYKNIIGTFGTPEAVCVDVELLGTLPAAEVRSGMAEVLKTLIIGDAELYHETVRWYGGVLERREASGNCRDAGQDSPTLCGDKVGCGQCGPHGEGGEDEAESGAHPGSCSGVRLSQCRSGGDARGGGGGRDYGRSGDFPTEGSAGGGCRKGCCP